MNSLVSGEENFQTIRGSAGKLQYRVDGLRASRALTPNGSPEATRGDMQCQAIQSEMMSGRRAVRTTGKEGKVVKRAPYIGQADPVRRSIPPWCPTASTTMTVFVQYVCPYSAGRRRMELPKEETASRVPGRGHRIDTTPAT